MALAERDKRALILGGVGLVLLGLYFGAVEPLTDRYGALRRSHEAAAADLARSVPHQQKNAYLMDRVKEWERSQGPLGAPRRADEAISSVGSQIIAAAQSSGVELQGATPGAVGVWPGDEQLQQCVFQIEAKADWEGFFKFVAALYRIDGVLSIEQADLSAGDAKKGGKLSLRTSVSVLLQGEARGAGAWAK